jgi:hypothetical protein
VITATPSRPTVQLRFRNVMTSSQYASPERLV